MVIFNKINTNQDCNINNSFLEETYNDGSLLKNSEVQVVLGHYNGKSFIEEQINSIIEQTHKYLTIQIFDDSSNHDDLEFLKKLAKKNKEKIILRLNSSTLGPTKNFLRGLYLVEQDAPFYAWADQDDIWHKNKLARALSIISSVDENKPTLYCSRTRLLNYNAKKYIGHSPLFLKTPSFFNALMQNIAGGNTMVMNRAAKDLLVAAGYDLNVVAHDWWAYMLISGAGGAIFFDTCPSVDYRQHEKNLIGSNNSFKARLYRLRLLLNNQFRNWNTQNILALNSCISFLTAKNQVGLKIFSKTRDGPLLTRLMGLKHSKVYRQSFVGNVALILASILKKL